MTNLTFKGVITAKAEANDKNNQKYIKFVINHDKNQEAWNWFKPKLDVADKIYVGDTVNIEGYTNRSTKDNKEVVFRNITNITRDDDSSPEPQKPLGEFQGGKQYINGAELGQAENLAFRLVLESGDFAPGEFDWDIYQTLAIKFFKFNKLIKEQVENLDENKKEEEKV